VSAVLKKNSRENSLAQQTRFAVAAFVLVITAILGGFLWVEGGLVAGKWILFVIGPIAWVVVVVGFLRGAKKWWDEYLR